MAKHEVGHVLATIDAALADHAVSPDAMRSAPAISELMRGRSSRADAIRAGELVEAPRELVHEAGLGVPVALTRAAWEDCVRWDPADGGMQDETGRLWDVLWMTRAAASRNPATSRADVVLYRVPRSGQGWTQPKKARLVAVIGPGDHGEAVLTLMLPEEHPKP